MPALSRRGGGSTVNAVGHGALAAQSTAALLRSQGLVGSAEGEDGSGKGDADTEAQADTGLQHRREKGKGSGRLSASASALVAGVPSFRAPRAKSSLVVPPLPTTTGGVVTQALLATNARVGPAPEASSPLAAPHSPLADASPSDGQRANPHRASSAMSFVGASPRASDFVPPSQASDTDAVSVVLPSRSDGCGGGNSDTSGDLPAEAAVYPPLLASAKAAVAEVPFVLSASSLSPQRRVAELPVCGHSEEHRVDVSADAAAADTAVDGVNPPSAIVGGKRTRDGDAVAPEVVPSAIVGVSGGAPSAQPTRGPSPAPAPGAPIAATTTVSVGRRANVGAPLRTPLNFSSLSRQSAPSRSPPQPLVSVMVTASGVPAPPADVSNTTATESVNKGVAVSCVAVFAAPAKRTLLSFGGGGGGGASAGPSATVSPRGSGSGGANSNSHLAAVAPASAEVSASSVPIQNPNVTVPAIISEDGDAQREQHNPKRTLLLFPAGPCSATTPPPPPVAAAAPQPQPSVGPPPSRTRIAVAPSSPNPQLIAASNPLGVVASAPPVATAHPINASAAHHSTTAHSSGGRSSSTADVIDYSRIDMSDLIVPSEQHAAEDDEAALLAGAKGAHFSADAPTDDDVNAFLFAMGRMPLPAVMRQQQQPSSASPPTAPVPSSHVASVVGASASGGPSDDAAAGSRRTLLFSAPPSAAAPSSGGIVAPALLNVAPEAGPSRATAVPISVAISSSKGSPFRTRPKATPLSFGPASAATPSAVVVEPSVNGANVSPTSTTGVPATPNAATCSIAAAADGGAESQSNAAAPKRTALSFPKPLPVAAPTVLSAVPTAVAAASPVPGRSVINLPPPAAPKQPMSASFAASLGSAPPNPLADTLPPSAPSPWEASLSDAFSKAAGGGRRAAVAAPVVVVAPTSVGVNAVAPPVPPPAVPIPAVAVAPITPPTPASAPQVAQPPPPPPPSTPFVIINKPVTARPAFQTRPSPSPAASHLLMSASPPPPPLTSPTTAVPIGGASTAAGTGSALMSPAAANPMVSANPPLSTGNLSGVPSALVAMAPTPRGPSVSVATSPFMVIPPSMHASQQRPLTPAPPTAAGPSPDGASAAAASSHNTGLTAASPHPPSVPNPQPQPPQQQGFYGLPEAARHLYAARGVTKGYAWQEEVLARPDVCAGDNFVYSLPTSGGKTFVAEVVLMRAILRAMGMGLGSDNNKGSVAQAAANGGAGSSCLFVLPFVSLAEEKCKALQPFADALHFNVEGYYGVQGRFPAPSAPTIFVCTIEKANSLYNHLVEEGRHSRLRCVVVDELHMVGETRRGPILELLLTKIRLASPRAQIVGMSATVPNLHQIAEWLGAGCYVGTFRPVPLKEHVVVNGIVTERCSEDPTQMVRPRSLPSADKSPLDDHMHIMHLLTEVPNCSTLVFCATRDQCLQYARQIVKTYDRMNIGPRPEGVGPLLADLRGLGHEARNLSELLPYGVAYHTGALSLEERDVVERGFKGRQITVLCCTSTLAAGVNLPARRVIFKTPYVAREFLQKSMYTQMCGRAGRAGFDVFGESFLVLSRRDAAQGMRLVMESLPPVHSGLFAERHGLARALMESLNVGVFATAANAKVWTRALMANFTHQPIPDRLLTDAAAIVKASPLFKNAPDVSGVEVGDSNGGQKEVAPRKGKGGEGRPKKKKSRTEKDKEQQQSNKEKNSAVAAVATLIESSASSLTLSRKGSDLTCHPPAAAAGTAAAVAATPRRRKESSNNGGAVGANTDAVCVDPHSPSPRSSKRPRGGGDGADANVGGAPPPTERFHTLSSLSQRRSRSAVGGATPSSMPRRRRAAAAVEVSDESSEEEEDEEEDEEDPIDLLIEGSIVTLVNCGLLTVEQLSPSATAVGSPSSGGAQSPTGALALLPSSATTPATTPAQRQPAAAVGGAGGGGGVLAMYGMLGLVGPSAGGGGGQGMQLDSDCPWGAAPTPPAGGAFGGLALGGTALGALLGANAGTNNGAGAPPTKPPPPSASSSLSAPIDISQPQHIPSQQYRLVLTPFGSASVRACFGIEEALLVRDEMETLQQSGVILTDDLQICYLVTPVMDPIECNWALFGKQMSSISDVRSRIAASVGLDVAFVHQRSVGLNFAHTAPPPAAATANASASSALAAVAGKHPSFHTAAAAAAAGDPPIIGGINGVSIDQHGRRTAADPQQRKLYVCRRYYAALILSDILNEVPSSTIEARYGLSYTQQQALLRSSSIFSSSMVAFCSTMSWFNVEALLAAFVKRLGFGVKPDIIPLMEISGVKASKARVLFAAGFRTPALIAASTPQELFRRVKESSPKDNKAAKFFTLKSAVVAIREANIVIQRQLREKKGELEEMALRAKMT